MSSSCFYGQFALCSPELTSALHHLPVKESLRDEAVAQRERREENIIVIQSLGVSGVSHRFPAETRQTTDRSPPEREALRLDVHVRVCMREPLLVEKKEIVTVKAL